MTCEPQVERRTGRAIGPDEVEGYRRGFLDRFPDADDHFLDWGVSCEVVIKILGIDWYREHLTVSRMHPYFLTQAYDQVVTYGGQDVLHTSLDQQGQPYELTHFVMRADLTGLLYDMPVE